MHRLRGPGRGLDELQHPSGTGQGVLQLGDHTGNLVEGLGILIGVVQQNRQAANADAAAEAEEGTGQSYQRIHHGIYKPGAGICQGREENRLQGGLVQPPVDLIELFNRSRLMAKGPNHLDLTDGLVHQARELPTGGAL